MVIELFPTLFRATSAGFCNFTGRLFGIAAPIVAELPQPTPWLAFLVVSVAAGLISTFLKVEETKQKRNFLRRWTANSVGTRLRQMGLRFEDTLNEAEPAVAMAIARLTPEQRIARDQRLRRALDLDFKKTVLPAEIQAVQDPFAQDLMPLVDQCIEEIDERIALTGEGPSRTTETYLKVYNE